MRRLALFATLIGVAVPTLASDQRALPPAERVVASASERFTLHIATHDAWKTPAAQATLLDRGQTQWSLALPHELGPRAAVVADNGTVVLLDEWINVPSRRAVTLISPAGRIVALHDAEAVVRTLGVPPRAVTAAARIGVWMSGEARVEGGLLLIPSGGRVLTVSLRDGALGVRR